MINHLRQDPKFSVKAKRPGLHLAPSTIWGKRFGNVFRNYELIPVPAFAPEQKAARCQFARGNEGHGHCRIESPTVVRIGKAMGN
jgi:hypothetical protein